jgi:ribosomal protein S27AE
VNTAKRLKRFIVQNSRKGQKCAECGSVFLADNGDGKVVAIFRIGTQQTSFYVLCASCGRDYKVRGDAAVPNAYRDAVITSLISPHSPRAKAPVWIH